MKYKQVPFAKNKCLAIDETLTYSEALTLLAHVGSPASQVAYILECASTDPGRDTLQATPHNKITSVEFVFQNCCHDIFHIFHKVIQTNLIEASHPFGFYQELAPGNLADTITRSSLLVIRVGGWALPLPGGCSW